MSKTQLSKSKVKKYSNLLKFIIGIIIASFWGKTHKGNPLYY